jgi:UDP-N-acetylmuramoyl-tripeptide--D-alanyl-D-alanine ligase
MEARSLEYICQAVSGCLAGPTSTLVTGISTDSRTVRQGDCFVAITGEKFDGHNFMQEVLDKGAAGVIAAADRVPATGLNGAFITVADTRRALGQLAARYRNDFDVPVVAVAGSNGKTTTKELIASILKRKYQTLWSEASFNNDIGVPMTLLKLERRHEAAVFEVGTNHPGELAPLVRMIQPQIGVITSIGREHLEFFGGLEGVAEEEGWLAELLPGSGMLFVNGDSEWTGVIARRTRAKVVTVGMHATNEWRASDATMNEAGSVFTVTAPSPRYAGRYEVRLLGQHQITNALLALAVGARLGLEPDELRQGLLEGRAPKMRLQLWEANGIKVLDDSYNANADSMIAALQTLHDFPADGRRVAVLGDMAELGGHTKQAHIEVGRRAAELALDQLFLVGEWAGETASAARAAGLRAAVALSDTEAAITKLASFLRKGDVLLLKASRASGLDRISSALKKQLEIC